MVDGILILRFTPPTLSTGASIADPFVLVRLGDGSLRLLVADPTDGEMAIDAPDLTLPAALAPPTLDDGSGPSCRDSVTASCLFCDEDGLLAAAAGVSPATGGCFAVIARSSGAVEVWAVAPWRFVATFPSAAAAPDLLLPAVARDLESRPTSTATAAGAPFIRDVAVQCLPALTMVLELSSGAVAVYSLPPPLHRDGVSAPTSAASTTRAPVDDDAEALPPLALDAAARAPLRWVKALGWGGGTAASSSSSWRAYSPRALVPFDNVCGWAGVAVLQPGAQPLLVVAARGGIPTALPLLLPSPVASAIGGYSLPGDVALGAAAAAAPPLVAPFHSVACVDGLLTVTRTEGGGSLLRCCQVPRPAWTSLAGRADVTTATGGFEASRDRLAQLYAPRRVPHGSVYDLVTQARRLKGLLGGR